MSVAVRNKPSNPDFWTDQDQARDRLVGSYVKYGTGLFVVSAVEKRGKSLEAYGYDPHDPNQTSVTCPLSDPNFKEFRELPPLGWVNVTMLGKPHAVYLERIPVRQRGHGLSNNNVSVRDLIRGEAVKSDRMNAQMVFNDAGYKLCLDGVYPSLEEVLDKVPVGSVVAVSNKFAICNDRHGLKWLYRGNLRIGMVSGSSLTLLHGMSCYREDIAEDPSVPFQTVTEL